MKTSQIVVVIAFAATTLAMPSRQARDLTKCSTWSGTCMPGSTYNTASEVTECQSEGDSSGSCQALCCDATVVPTPDTMCSEWNGKCETGSIYIASSELNQCVSDPSDATLSSSCQNQCCGPFIPAITCSQATGFACSSDQIETSGTTCCETAGECGADVRTCSQDTCCVAVVPTPNTMCSEWNGKCETGSIYISSSELNQCVSDPSDAALSSSCQNQCCGPFVPAITCSQATNFACDPDQIETSDTTCCETAGECGADVLTCSQDTCCEAKLY